MAQLTREQIEQKKSERAAAKRLMIDSLRKNVGTLAVPSIMIMVGTLVGSAYYLKSEALAVVTGLVSTVTLGLINVLQQMTLLYGNSYSLWLLLFFERSIFCQFLFLWSVVIDFLLVITKIMSADIIMSPNDLSGKLGTGTSVSDVREVVVTDVMVDKFVSK